MSDDAHGQSNYENVVRQLRARHRTPEQEQDEQTATMVQNMRDIISTQHRSIAALEQRVAALDQYLASKEQQIAALYGIITRYEQALTAWTTHGA